MKKLLLLILLIPMMVSAEMVDITFEPPTEREDGTILPASEIAGYQVFDNAVEIPPADLVFTGNSVAVDLPYGRRTITMKTVDTNDRVSISSVPFVFVLNANPNAPKVIGASRRK